MINPEALTEKLLFSTVKIQTQNGSGTGFFFHFQNGDYLIPVIVTNKHVVHGAQMVELLLHTKSEDGVSDINIPVVYQTEWMNHPTLDLCCTPIAPLIQHYKDDLKQEIYYLPFVEENILHDSFLKTLRAMEDIIMIGYPIGLWDDVHNMPLLRKGITSTHPVLDFKGEKKGVIDAACFPGSSGSPICIINEGGYVDKNGTTNVGGGRFGLLGILFAGPIHNAQGEIIVQEIPTQQVASANTPMMINLGYYIKADQMLELKKVVFGHFGIGGLNE